MERLRLALGSLIDAVPGVERASDLRRALDLDVALAWQVHTLSTSADVLRSCRVVPKAGAMERLCRAAKADKSLASYADEVEQAYAEFERVVADHAGDRETFDAIVSAMRPEDGVALQKTRRSAFKANAALWGVSVRAAINCVVFNQRPTGECDCLTIKGRIGVRRLRDGVSVAMYASARTWGGTSCPPEGTANVQVDSCELLPHACSTPVPTLHRREMPDGSWRDFLELEGVGRSSEVTVIWRTLSLAFPGGSSRPPHGCTYVCLEPTEAAVVCLLVPRGWTDPRTVGTSMTPADTQFLPSGGAGQTVKMPLEVQAEHLGSRVESMFTRHAPKLPEIVGREITAQGWDLASFDIYRSIVPYPILHASAHLFADGPGSA